MPTGGKYVGARSLMSAGYVEIRVPVEGTHKMRKVLEHVAVAEKAIGRRLPKGARVHHVDGNKTNNASTNLVVCPNEEYHRLLHIRADALAACGNANYRRCKFCDTYDEPQNLKAYRSGLGVLFHHRLCYNAYQAQRYRARKEQP